MKSVVHVHTADIDPTVVKSGATLERARKHLRRCREEALEASPKATRPPSTTRYGHVGLDEGHAPFDPGAGRARRKQWLGESDISHRRRIITFSGSWATGLTAHKIQAVAKAFVPMQYATTSDGVRIAFISVGDGSPIVFASNIFGDATRYAGGFPHMRDFTDRLACEHHRQIPF